jgi:hypothetical protein
MLELGRTYGSFDLISVAAQLDHMLVSVGGAAYLSDLECGGIERSNIDQLCRAICEKAALRKLARDAETLQAAALAPGATPDQCKQRAAELMSVFDVAHGNRLTVCSAGEFLATDIPPREMVLAPFLPEQGLAMLYSKRGVGKTYLSLAIAITVASGGTFLRWKAPKPRKVLFVDGELPASTLQQRIRSIQAGHFNEEAIPDLLRIITPDMQTRPMPDLATVEGQGLIERELPGVELLVLDNLSALCRSGKENEGESWLPVQEWLLRLRQQGISVLANREQRRYNPRQQGPA